MEEELKRLQRENQELREQVKELLGLREQNQRLREQLDLALAQLEERKKQTKDPPGFVKAKVSKPKKEGPCKKRKPEHNGARKRESPTQIEEHFAHICPDCQGILSGISLSRRRHKSRSRNTGSTKDAVAAARSDTKPHLNVVMGQGRLEVCTSTVIAYLRTVMRLPIGHVQSYLQTLHGLRMSVG